MFTAAYNELGPSAMRTAQEMLPVIESEEKWESCAQDPHSNYKGRTFLFFLDIRFTTVFKNEHR